MASMISLQDPIPTSDSHGPLARAILWVMVSVSAIFLGLRIFCKFLKNRGLWWDDYVLIASWVSLLGDVILTTYNISLGSGNHIEEIDPANLSTITFDSLLIASFAIFAAVWSKTSFGMTLLRIASGRTKVAVWFCIVSMNLLMGINAFTTWLQCNPIQKEWIPDLPGDCWDRRVNAYFGVVAGVYSGVMDIILAFLPWSILWNLQMKRKEKVGVAVAMSMGAFAGSTAFMKSYYIPTLLSGDFSFDGWRLEIWGTTEVAVTIMAASIPVLRVLIKEVTTATRRYASGDVNSFHSKSFNSPSSARFKTVVTSHHGKEPFEEMSFSSSYPTTSASSLREGSASGSKGGGTGILQTQEITIRYHDKGSEPDLEMGEMI